MTAGEEPAAGPPPHAPAPPDGLCLDFANTRYWRGTASPTEELQVPADLLRWCEARQMLDPETLRRLRAWWEGHPADAEAGFAGAIALREALYRIFAAVAAGALPASADLEALNAALRAAPGRMRLRPLAGAHGWEVPRQPPPGLAMLLAPVLWSAGDLLAAAPHRRLRQCENDRCLWLFVDDSKGGNRRWCSMATCGNRAKAHRHYARSKQPR
jgi:predicted RNA-binding Zn ribbon-like protein